MILQQWLAEAQGVEKSHVGLAWLDGRVLRQAFGRQSMIMSGNMAHNCVVESFQTLLELQFDCGFAQLSPQLLA